MTNDCPKTPARCRDRPSEVRSCDDRKQPNHPIILGEPGSSCTVTVYADIKNDNTRVSLVAGMPYRFSISGIDSWYDCTQEATPFRGWCISEGKGLSLVAKALLYASKPTAFAPSAGFMELLGVVAGQQFRLGRIAEPSEEGGLSPEVFCPKNTGELILRVNEPRFGGARFYNNNSGKLELTITRISHE